MLSLDETYFIEPEVEETEPDTFSLDIPEEEPKTYTLTIEGTTETFTIDNLSKNGTNYLSEIKINTSNWPDIFSLTVTNNDGNITECIKHARLIQQVKYNWDNNYYLAFAPVSQLELMKLEHQAKIEYIAMMSDVDLDS